MTISIPVDEFLELEKEQQATGSEAPKNSSLEKAAS